MSDGAWFKKDSLKTNIMFIEVAESSNSRGVSDANETGTNNPRENEDSHKKIAKEFISSTTAHGLPRAYEAKNWFRSLFWSLIVCTAFIASVSQIVILLQQYIKREVSVRIEMNSALEAEFPTITICNTNKLRKSALAESKHAGILAVDNEIARPYYAVSCLEGDLRCNNSGCIKSYLRCDGYDNCRDMTDEVGCKYGDCGYGQFKCTSGSPYGFCISNSFKCDRELDCYGGEDENHCECKNAKKEFECPEIGRCISVDLLCDGTKDCPKGEDEAECNDDGVFCAEDYFKCDENRNCIPPAAKCDGFNQCMDGTDEKDCPTPDPNDVVFCPPDEFQCDEYTCIHGSWRCDGMSDCFNGNDEKHCSGRSTPATVGGGGGDGDGETDDCYAYGLNACGDGGCFPDHYRCDNYDDCTNGHDEENCEAHTIATTTTETYLCPSGQPLIISQVCDGYNDCGNYEDEQNCPAGPSKNYSCESSSTEIEWKHVCNNVVDCEDASDEKMCEHAKNATYIPDPEDLKYVLPKLKASDFLVEDFLNQYYHDHMLGAVKSEDPADWHGFIAFSQNPDYSDLENVLKLDEEELQELGHQLEDFVMECNIDGVECDRSEIYAFRDDTYGNCFQLNSQEVVYNRMVSTETGAKHGLTMTLFTEQDEYTSVYGRDSGVRLVISPIGKPVLPSAEGVTIRPGMVSSVGIKETLVIRKGAPYGFCTPTGVKDNYSERHCEQSCVQQRMLEYCGCVDTIQMPGERCQLLNRTQDTCKQFIYYLGTKGQLDCDCPWSCTESWYETSISESLWPSNAFLKHFLKQIHFLNKKTENINDMKAVRENFVRLIIYFEDLNFQSITEFPTITEESLMSNIGGTLGLYCGFSFITIVEFLQFFYDMFCLTYKKYVHRKIRPH